MYRTQSRRDQRQLDRSQRRAAANRRIGHDMAYYYEGARLLGPVLAVVALAVVAWWVWTHVDHVLIAEVVGGLGAAMVFVYCAVAYRLTRLATRMNAMASGSDGHIHTAWHAIGGAGVLLAAAGILIWRQWS